MYHVGGRLDSFVTVFQFVDCFHPSENFHALYTYSLHKPLSYISGQNMFLHSVSFMGCSNASAQVKGFPTLFHLLRFLSSIKSL